jgi:GAF domain-containing protein
MEMISLEEIGLLDGPYERNFNHITALATQSLNTDVSLISIVDFDGDRQFFKSHQGLGEPWKTSRQTPLSHSFCKHVVLSNRSLVVSYATEHPMVRSNPAITDLGVMAYLGVPVKTPDGNPVGAICVIDNEPRTWGLRDIQTLECLAEVTNDAIEVSVAQSNSLENSAPMQHGQTGILLDHALKAIRDELREG